MTSSLSAYRPVCLAAFGLLIVAGGCQQQTASKLLGRWIGRADTAVARDARQRKKYGDFRPADPVAPLLGDQDRKTDWENYEVAVAWNFLSAESLVMSLADGSQSLAGTWIIIGTSPTGCMIEVVTGEPAEGAQGDEKKVPLRRRFEIDLDERDGDCVGFLLYETGADRQLGALYFRRPTDAE